MKFYTQQHKYYCGIDLHARTMYICILDQKGKIKFHENNKNSESRQRDIIRSFLICNSIGEKD